MNLDLAALPIDVDALHRLVRDLATQAAGDRTELTQAWAEVERLRLIMAQLYTAGVPVALVGEFNVVPTVSDIYKTKSWDKDALLQPAKQHRRGYADDIVVGFQRRANAERSLDELRQRLKKFGLGLHPQKTRIIEFGRFAERNRKAHGLGKPETFAFLGFTHICGTNNGGSFLILRHTIRKRLREKIRQVKEAIGRMMHRPSRPATTRTHRP